MTAVLETRRLLDGGASLLEHRARFGPLPTTTARRLLDEVDASGLTGRGGARFPLATKLRAVAAGRRPVVVANGAEGEPASRKDRTLMHRSPHLVLDGLASAAHAVGAGQALAYVHPAAAPAMRRAAAERSDRVPVEVVTAAEAFVSGQETAVVRSLGGGPALPRSAPPRVFERGLRGRPTLVSNVETLAQLALVARYGADEFRRLGTAAEPGTMLCTVTGTDGRPVVVEAALGTPVADVLQRGGCAPTVPALLVGGFHGAWVTGDEARSLRLSAASLAPTGAAPGAGVLLALAPGRCPLQVSAGIVRYLADSSARQCGPCLSGLPALARTLAAMAQLGWSTELVGRASQLTRSVAGRGACAHPDGTVRLVRSVLQTFGPDLDAHADGRCLAGAA